MTRFAAPEAGAPTGRTAPMVGVRPARTREAFEAIGLLAGTLGILLVLALTVGAALPVGP